MSDGMDNETCQIINQLMVNMEKKITENNKVRNTNIRNAILPILKVFAEKLKKNSQQREGNKLANVSESSTNTSATLDKKEIKKIYEKINNILETIKDANKNDEEMIKKGKEFLYGICPVLKPPPSLNDCKEEKKKGGKKNRRGKSRRRRKQKKRRTKRR